MEDDRAPHPAWGEASREVADAYFPHELRHLGGASEPQLTLSTVDLGPVLIGHVGWGSDVAVDCDYPSAYEVNMPLAGRMESHGRHGLVTSVPGQGTVFRADTPALISHWGADCTVLGVKFTSSWLEVEAERILGTDRVAVRELIADQLDLTDGPAQAWYRLVSGLAAQLRGPDTFGDSPLVKEQLAGAVAAGLLVAVAPDSSHGAVQPVMIRRVTDQLHDDPARAWTGADMATLAGTSLRRLQEGFQRWLGMSPTEYLRDIRLSRAHADLAADPTATVSDVAARWGFSSASRFAAAYRQRYGRSPSRSRQWPG